jgi:DNA polymerase III subunit delta
MPAKTSKASRIYFLTGTDESAVKKAATALVEKLSPGADAFGRETIDGAVEGVDNAANSIHETIQALLTLPFLGGAKLVWLKSASSLTDTVTGRSETVLAPLLKLCQVLSEGLPDGVTFVLSAPLADKRRTAYRTLSKIATTEVHNRPELGFGAGEEQFIEWTTSYVRARDLQLDAEAIEALTARVGLDTRQLDNELEKLETAFGTSRSINANEVRALVPQTREGGIFDLSNALAHRDLPLALETLDQLLEQGEKGIGILLAAIVPTMRNLLIVKELMLRHKLAAPNQPNGFARSVTGLPEEAVAHLPRKKDGTISAYALGIAAINSSHYSLPELETGFAACASANQQLFSGSTTEDVVITRLLIGIMARNSRQSV